MERRTLIQMAFLSAGALFLPELSRAADSSTPSLIDIIKTRRSVRAYNGEAISDADLKTILECGMLAPSAANEQPWEFVVINDKSVLDKIGSINHYASYASKAPLAILVCLDLQKEKEKGMGVLDIACACENMLLAAHALGLGGVFTGIYPYKDRMEGFQKLVNLPSTVEPISLLVFGHPKMNNNRVPDRFQQADVHYNTWDKTSQ